MNDLRPVALTPIAMKVFERIVLGFILNQVKDKLDPFQFAYKAKRNVEDTCLIFINSTLKQLDIPRTHVRSLFIDFSSAFNTIQPHILAKKLMTHVKRLIAWVM